MSYESEYDRGHRTGARDNPAAEAGARDRFYERQREQAEAARDQCRSDQALQAFADATQGSGPASGSTGTAAGSWSSGGGGSGGSMTLRGSMSMGAMLGVTLVVFIWVFGSADWTLQDLVARGLAGGAVGALAGAALYVALVVLLFALKVAFVLLALGVVLHLLGTIDLFSVLQQLTRML